jgi:hypothetical protein
MKKATATSQGSSCFTETGGELLAILAGGNQASSSNMLNLKV